MSFPITGNQVAENHRELLLPSMATLTTVIFLVSFFSSSAEKGKKLKKLSSEKTECLQAAAESHSSK